MENTDNEQGNEQGNEQLITDVKYVYDVEQLQKNEEKVQIAKLVDDTAHLKDIITKLNELIGTDGEKIATAELITNETAETIQDTQETIHEAREYQKKSMMLKGTILCTCIGACIGGPIGGIMGHTINLTVMGAILGGASMGGFMGSIAHYALK